jgi:hypothetical protein
MHNKHSHHALEKLRQVDLNLLITFAALAEGKKLSGGRAKQAMIASTELVGLI